MGCGAWASAFSSVAMPWTIAPCRLVDGSCGRKCASAATPEPPDAEKPAIGVRLGEPSKAYTPTFWNCSTFEVKACAAACSCGTWPDCVTEPDMSTSNSV